MVSVSWLVVATVLAAIPVAVLWRLVWRQRREPGAKPYAYVLVAVVVYDLVYATSLVVTDRVLHELVFGLASSILLAHTVPWIVFALEYTGRGRLVTGRLVAALLSLPVLSVVVLASPFRNGLLVDEYTMSTVAGGVVATYGVGPFGLVLSAFGFGLAGLGLLMLLSFVVSDRRRYGAQTGALAFGGLLPTVMALVRLLGVSPMGPLDLTPFAFALVAPVVGYALVHWELFSFSPATRRVGQLAAIDDLGDAVVILDEDHRIVEANPQAVRLFGMSESALVQTSIEVVLGESVDPALPDRTIRLDTDRGRRDFALSVSQIDGPRGGTIGHTMVLYDVTDEKQRRQIFEVLNRILRHNLRNSMNAVVGYSSELERHVDGSADWMIDRIQEQSARLVELSEKARDIDRVTNLSQSYSSIDVDRMLERVGDQLADDHEDVSVTIHVSDDLSVTSDDIVFEEVIRYAASSLVTHNGTEGMRLAMTATQTDADRSSLDVTITSNGDPVPADERAVIERGEETPLDHSHDLNLWLVSWGVETLGGDLAFIVEGDRPGLELTIPDLEVDGGKSTVAPSG